MNELAGVFFHVNAGQVDAALFAVDFDIHVAALADGQVKLGRLEVFRQIRIIVVFAVKFAVRQNVAVQCQPCFDGKVEHFLIEDRQHAGQAQADRADVGIRFGAEFSAAAAENLCLRFQFDVDFQADNGFVFHYNSTSPIGNGLRKSVLFCSKV